jgi:uncharacterized protein YciI
MKLLALLLVLTFSSVAQQPVQKAFLIRIQPVRPTFVHDATKEEGKVMGEHFEYLKKLTAEGKVVLAGPSINGEKTFGLIVVETNSEADARSIMENDPSYKAGIQRGEVLPFTISILRGRD